MRHESVRYISWLCIVALLLQACATAGLAGDLEPGDDAPEDVESARLTSDHLPPWETRSKADTSLQGLEANLLTYASTHTGEVRLTLHRQRQSWRLSSYSTTDSTKPLEAKTLPVRRAGVTAETLTQAHAAASRLARSLHVPEGGSTMILAEVRLDDDRVLDATLVRQESQGGPPGKLASLALEAALTQALLPFTSGVGPRRVRLKLEANPSRGPSTSWCVVEAETPQARPPGTPTLVDEHYALYERILREWREETEASFIQAGLTSAEFLATWFVSSLALRGGQVLLEALAPRLAPILARGGTEAVGWFRSFLARVRPQDRERLQRLSMKAQTRGLSAVERNQLQKLLHRLEKLLESKLDDTAKGKLRSSANSDFYTRHHPELARILVDAKNNPYPIHHRSPLEYAHLFPSLDINASMNLAAVDKAVHVKINNVWTTFRAVGTKATASDVERVVELVDRHFARWYNKAYVPQQSTQALDEAAKLAIREVEDLVNLMKRG